MSVHSFVSECRWNYLDRIPTHVLHLITATVYTHPASEDVEPRQSCYDEEESIYVPDTDGRHFDPVVQRKVRNFCGCHELQPLDRRLYILSLSKE